MKGEGEPWDAELASRVIAQHRAREGAVLPILHALQECFGYIDKAAVALVAEALNISKAEVHGVVTFYHDFRQAPVEGDVLKLCRAEACQSMGCEDLGRSSGRRAWRRARQTSARRVAPCRNDLLPRQLRPVARRLAERRSGRPARSRRDRRHRRRRVEERTVSARIYVPADSAALSVGAERVAAEIAAGGAPPRPRRRHRAQRLARPVLAGAAD